MMDIPRVFRSLSNRRSGEADPQVRVAAALDAIGGADRLTSLNALFPHLAFEPLAERWPEVVEQNVDVLIVSADASQAVEIDRAVTQLARLRGRSRVAVVLRNADVTTTRRLIRAGAADVLPAPAGEPALALSLERLLTPVAGETGSANRSGQVVAVLKAGGGAGATALAVQASFLLAQRSAGEVCVADLDLQFGSAGLYMDLPDAITITDCISSSPGLVDTPYASALATHRSRVRLLAAPRDIVPLEALNPDLANAMVSGLRRDFALTLVDLPAVWTAWTNQILQDADRIVLVVRLTVPQIQLAKRQLRMLAAQRHNEKPLTLVCNAMTADQGRAVSLKSAERALGREFDVVVPDDQRMMDAALNQGVELAAVRRGTKLEKAIGRLADSLMIGAEVGSVR